MTIQRITKIINRTIPIIAKHLFHKEILLNLFQRTILSPLHINQTLVSKILMRSLKMIMKIKTIQKSVQHAEESLTKMHMKSMLKCVKMYSLKKERNSTLNLRELQLRNNFNSKNKHPCLPSNLQPNKSQKRINQ